MHSDGGVGGLGRQTFPWKCENKDGDCCILTLFETIFWNCRENVENKDKKWCIPSLFGMIV